MWLQCSSPFCRLMHRLTIALLLPLWVCLQGPGGVTNLHVQTQLDEATGGHNQHPATNSLPGYPCQGLLAHPWARDVVISPTIPSQMHGLGGVGLIGSSVVRFWGLVCFVGASFVLKAYHGTGCLHSMLSLLQPVRYGCPGLLPRQVDHVVQHCPRRLRSVLWHPRG